MLSIRVRILLTQFKPEHNVDINGTCEQRLERCLISGIFYLVNDVRWSDVTCKYRSEAAQAGLNILKILMGYFWKESRSSKLTIYPCDNYHQPVMSWPG